MGSGKLPQQQPVFGIEDANIKLIPLHILSVRLYLDLCKYFHLLRAGEIDVQCLPLSTRKGKFAFIALTLQGRNAAPILGARRRKHQSTARKNYRPARLKTRATAFSAGRAGADS